jgi:MFS family permease
MRLALPASLPKLSRDAWAVNAALMVFAAAFMGITQLLRVIYLLRLGAGLETIGVLYASGSILFAVLGLPSGAIGERLGSRRALLLGAVILFVGLSFLPLTEAVPEALRPVWPVIAELVNTVGWSLLVVNSVPILVATTPPEHLRSAYALREALMGFASLVGLVLAGLLPEGFALLLGISTATPAPYRYGLAVSFVLGALAVFLVTRTGSLVYSRPATSGRRGQAPWGPIILLLICGFLNQGGVASCRVFTYAYMDTAFGMPTSAIGIINGIGMGCAVFAALNSTRLARRFGSGRAMTIASVALVLDLLLMAFVPHWLAASVGTIGVLALFSLWMPAYQTLQMEFAGPGQRGVVSGAGFMALGLGFAAMSLLGGQLAASIGYTPLFLLGAGMALSSAALMLYVHRLRLRRGDNPDQGGDSAAEPLPLAFEPEAHSVGG